LSYYSANIVGVVMLPTPECPLPNYIEEGKTTYCWFFPSKTKEITVSGYEMAEVHFSGNKSKTSMGCYSSNIGVVLLPTPGCPLLTM
jgi:hypothetical protein